MKLYNRNGTARHILWPRSHTFALRAAMTDYSARNCASETPSMWRTWTRISGTSLWPASATTKARTRTDLLASKQSGQRSVSAYRTASRPHGAATRGETCDEEHKQWCVSNDIPQRPHRHGVGRVYPGLGPHVQAE